MLTYKKDDYDIISNEKIDSVALNAFPNKIFNLILYNKWQSYKLNFNIESKINERTLYNMAISGNILAFSYTLFKCRKNLVSYFRIIPQKQANIKKIFDQHYISPDIVIQPYEVPLKIFAPKRFYITIDNINTCSICKKKTIINNIGCLNFNCSNYFTNFMPHFEIKNKNGQLLYDYDYVEKNIALSNETKTHSSLRYCYKCNRCKKCTKDKKLCKKHLTCPHLKNKKLTKKELENIIKNIKN